MSISETAQTAITLYNQLSQPNCPNANEITTNLQNFYSTPEAFGVLYEVIKSQSNIPIQKHAAVGIRTVIKQTFSNIPNQEEVYYHLLELCEFLNDTLARNLIIDITTTVMLPQFIPIVGEFLQKWAQNLNQVTISAFVNISPTYSMLNPIDPEVEGAILNFHSDNIEIIYNQTLYILNKFNAGTEEDEDQSMYTETYMTLLQLLQRAADESLSDVFNNAQRQLKYQLSMESPIVNFDATLEILKNIVANGKMIPQIRGQALDCLNFLIAYYSDAFSEVEFSEECVLVELYYLYFNYAMEVVQENDSYYIASQNVFDTMMNVFSKNQDFLQFLYDLSNQDEIRGDISRLCCMIPSLINSFSNGFSFYQDKLGSLCELFTELLRTNFIYLITAASEGFKELYKVFGDSISEYMEGAISRAVEILQDSDNSIVFPEILKLLKYLIKSSQNADEIFGPLTELLSNLFSDPSNRITILSVFRKLINQSDSESGEHYDELYQFFVGILNDSSEEATPLHASAVACISALGEKNPEQFSENVVDFFSTVLGYLQSEDVDLVYESILAIGHMTQTFGEDLGDSLMTAIDMLVPIAASDLTPPQSNDDDDDEQEEALDEQFKNLLKNVGSALRVLTLIVKEIPEKSVEMFDAIFQDIEKLMNHAGLFATCISDAAISVINLGRGLLKTDSADKFSEQATKMIGLFTPELSYLINPDSIGTIFDVICDLASDFGLESLFNFKDIVLTSVQSALTVETEEYVEIFHENAQRILREILDQMHDEAFPIVEPYIQVFQGLLSKTDVRYHELALQFFGDLLLNCPAHVDEEFINSVFTLAMSAINLRKSTLGLNALKQIAKISPGFVNNNIEQILGVLDPYIDPSLPKTSENMSLQDNSVSCLGIIAMNVLKDSFPFDKYAQRALALMPAQYESEENRDIIPFFFFIYEKTNNTYLKDVCAVLVRLFSDDERDILENFVTNEQLLQLAVLFKIIIPQVGNIQQFFESIIGKNRLKMKNLLTIMKK